MTPARASEERRRRSGSTRTSWKTKHAAARLWAAGAAARAAEGIDFGDAERRPAHRRVAEGRILGADRLHAGPTKTVGAGSLRGRAARAFRRAGGADVVTLSGRHGSGGGRRGRGAGRRQSLVG